MFSNVPVVNSLGLFFGVAILIMLVASLICILISKKVEKDTKNDN